MSLAFKVEKWAECLPQLLPLFDLLWADVAIDQQRFVAECDQERYAALDAAGAIHLVTARSGSLLVGFFVMLLLPNPHYKGQGLMAFTDLYFLRERFRSGNAGLQLFSFMEKTLREKGVVKAYTSHKIHRDRSAMLKLLGWNPSDIVYSKVLA